MAGPGRVMPWPVPSISAANWWIGGCSAFGAHFGGRACDRPQTFAGRTRQPLALAASRHLPAVAIAPRYLPAVTIAAASPGLVPVRERGIIRHGHHNELQTQAQVAPRMLLIQLSTLIVSIKSGRKSPKSSEGRPIRLPETTQRPLLPHLL